MNGNHYDRIFAKNLLCNCNLNPSMLKGVKRTKNNMMSKVVKAEIKNSVKSDHPVVLIDLKINKIKRGPGIF